MTHLAPTLTMLDDNLRGHRPFARWLPGPDTPMADELTDLGQDWSWVIAAPFRAHVRQVLTAEPLPWRAFAAYARVPDNVVRGVLGLGRRRLRRIAPHYAHALLSVDPKHLRTDLVRPVEPDDALEAARTLLAAGWTMAQVSRAGSLTESRLRALLSGEDLMITQRTALLITAAARAHGLATDEFAGMDAVTEPLAA